MSEGMAVGALEVQRVAVDDDFRHDAVVEVAQQIRKRYLRDDCGLTGMEQEGAGYDRHGNDRGGDPNRTAGPLASKHVTLRLQGQPRERTWHVRASRVVSIRL